METEFPIEREMERGLGEGEEVLTLGELDFLFAQKLIVSIKPDSSGLGLVSLDENFDLEGLAFFEFGGQLKFFDRTIVGAGHTHGDDIDGHAEIFAGEGGGHGIADVFVAVGHEDEAFLAVFGESGGTQANGGGEVGPFSAHDGLDFLEIDGGVRHGFDAGFGAKDDDAGLIDVSLQFGAVVDVSLGEFLLLRGDAVRAVERVEDVHTLDGQQPLEAGDSKDDGSQNQRANDEGGPTPPLADLDIGFPCEPHDPAQSGQEQKEIEWASEVEHGQRENFKSQNPNSRAAPKPRLQALLIKAEA